MDGHSTPIMEGSGSEGDTPRNLTAAQSTDPYITEPVIDLAVRQIEHLEYQLSLTRTALPRTDLDFAFRRAR